MRTKRQYLVLVRHGQSRKCVAIEQGSNNNHYNVTGTDREIELTELGKQQAHTSGLWLAPLFPPNHPIDRIWLSGFTRVAQSAEQIISALGYQPPCSVDKRLEKRSYGRFWNLTLTGIQELYPEEYALMQTQGPLLYCPPDGESHLTFSKRVSSFVSEHIDPVRENLLLPAHLAVMVEILCKFCGLGPDEALKLYQQMHFPNGGILMFSRSGPGHSWEFCQFPHESVL